LLEVGEFLGGEDEGFGVDAGFEGIHGGDGLACDRGGAVDFCALRRFASICRRVDIWVTPRREGRTVLL
jgi:hypothetical protein